MGLIRLRLNRCPGFRTAPNAAIESAKAVWSEFALELDADPLATVASLEFPNVTGDEDSGRIVYAELTAAERRRVDSIASNTHHKAGVNL